LVFAFGLVYADSALGGRLELLIQAGNPANVKKTVHIRSNLPARITPADIEELDSLNLGYDVKSDIYYVEDYVEMDPKETRPFSIIMRDIWLIDEGQVELYSKRAKVLSSLLSGSDYSADSSKVFAEVKTKIDEILVRQKENGITIVEPIKHIQAYEQNIKTLQAVKLGIGKMENYALAAGINPGKNLIGDDISASVPKRNAHIPKEYGEAIMKITVRNSSATQSIKTDVRSNLPPELSVDDVVDAGGLEVRYDPKLKCTYVFKYDLELQPQESVTYKIRLNDKWNVNGERMKYLQDKANDLLDQSSGRNSIEAVINTLDTAVKDLDSVMKATGPAELNPAYIAYYRRQADSLDKIEKKLNRVDAALKPLQTNTGFKIDAPDKKTTWLIIYVILGFLAVMSLLFFLRWYVQSS